MAGEKVIKSATEIQKSLFKLKKLIREMDKGDSITKGERDDLVFELMKSILPSMVFIKDSLLLMTALEGSKLTDCQKKELEKMDFDIAGYRLAIGLRSFTKNIKNGD